MDERLDAARRAMRLVASGRVQGVGFRAFVVGAAGDCEVVGFVRNLESGEVEIWAEGSPAALERLIEAVKRGPRHAHVRGLSKEQVAVTGAHDRFTIRS